MVLFRFLQIFRVDTGLRFLKAIVMFLKETLEHFSSLSHVGGCLLPIVRSYSWFPPSRALFLGLHALNLSPKEVKFFHRKIGDPPWYFPPHPQLEPEQPVVVVSGWESFFDLPWTFHLHRCRFIGKRPLQEQRPCEMAGAWDLSSRLGCANAQRLLFHVFTSLSFPKRMYVCFIL